MGDVPVFTLGDEEVVRLITQWISSDDVGFESEDVFVAGGEIPHVSSAMANSIPSHRPFVGS